MIVGVLVGSGVGVGVAVSVGVAVGGTGVGVALRQDTRRHGEDGHVPRAHDVDTFVATAARTRRLPSVGKPAWTEYGENGRQCCCRWSWSCRWWNCF